jgi:hypothetical protein
VIAGQTRSGRPRGPEPLRSGPRERFGLRREDEVSLDEAVDLVGPFDFGATPTEIQFVHIPEDGALPSGFWGELALDGIVLFDPSLQIYPR